MSVLSYVVQSDDRVAHRLVRWRPPSWFRVWMLWATRLGDGWLWIAVAVVLLAAGGRGLAILAGGLVSAALANLILVATKGRVRRQRPTARPCAGHFDVTPLNWFAGDRFSFPSGHALNAFAVGSLVALALPWAAAPMMALAVSVATSRVVLGLHWLSDVLAGAVMGGLIGALVWLTLLR